MRLALLCALFFTFSAFAASPVVIMETNMGTIEIELNEEKAPITVKNFLSYVDDKFYDNTIFHRVINGFMIQGGGFEEGMKEKKTKAPIVNEAKNGLRNDEGTIAMARTGDPNSATAQFFINVNSNDNLNYPQPDGHGYAVFGKVLKGMHVVNRIKMVKTGNIGMHQNVPMDTVLIKSVRRAGAAEAPAAPAAEAPKAPEKKKSSKKKK
jgi:peptidyl-prolyl cis-trans isomerase A (cyclophilin A)